MVRPYHDIVDLLSTREPPRQASPPGADVGQSQQCICISHLPPIGGELALAVLFQQPHVSVLVISPPQEGN